MSAFLLPTHKVLAKVFRQKKCRCILPKPLSKCRRRGRPRRQKQAAHPSFLTPFPLTQISEKKKKNLALARAQPPGAASEHNYDAGCHHRCFAAGRR